jgi:Carboxypeptidase regulatory-like domain
MRGRGARFWLSVLAVAAALFGGTSSAVAIEGGQITGKVLAASNSVPLEGIEVCAWLMEGTEEPPCVLTDVNGNYTLKELASGQYIVEFAAPFESGLNYITQYWEGTTSFSNATPVSVSSSGTVSGIDAKLAIGGRITGRVTDAFTSAALNGAHACAVGLHAEAFSCSKSEASGEYTISGLPSGEYEVVFFDGPGYKPQAYNGKSPPSEANPVSVSAGSVTTGINAALEPLLEPVNTALPTISGAPAVGANLTCSNGSWTANPSPSFTYSWFRDSTLIEHSTVGAYTVQAADEGHTLACKVTAVNTQGTVSATSAGLAIPIPPPPPPPPAPTPTVTIASSHLVVSKHQTPIRLECDHAACRGTVELTVQIETARHVGHRRVVRKTKLVLAKGSFSLAAGAGATVVLHLTVAGIERLKSARSHPLAAQITISIQAGKATTEKVRVR